MKNKYVWSGSIIGLILLLDQFSKYIVEKHVRLFEVIRVIPGFFNLTHVRNRGAAFGILSNMPAVWRTLFFVSVTAVAVGLIALYIKKTNERLQLVAFSLIAGGAVGNAIDRIRYGEVVDFIQWYVKSYYWPSFNIADSAISVGVCLLAIDMLFLQKARTAEISKS